MRLRMLLLSMDLIVRASILPIIAFCLSAPLKLEPIVEIKHESRSWFWQPVSIWLLKGQHYEHPFALESIQGVELRHFLGSAYGSFWSIVIWLRPDPYGRAVSTPQQIPSPHEPQMIDAFQLYVRLEKLGSFKNLQKSIDLLRLALQYLLALLDFYCFR